MPSFEFKNHKLIFSLVAVFTALSFFIFSQIPKTFAAAGINRQINFQGKLVNTDGTNAANGSYTITFSLYNHPTLGSPASGYLWQEQQTVTVTDGIFRVALGSVTPIPTNFNFNWDGLYLGLKVYDGVHSDSEMTPRIQMAAVPMAFNAAQVDGLTVQDSTGNASTAATLQIGTSGSATTVNLGANNLTLTTSGTTTLKLPTGGTVLSYADTAQSGTLASITSATNQNGAETALAITMGTSTSQTQYGLQFALSGSGGTAYDILGTGTTWYVTNGGALHVSSCVGCGGGTNYWNLVSGLGVAGGGYLSPINSTADLLIGGQATSSAVFAVLGLSNSSHQTTASVSGNLIVVPNNGFGGNVGIGTTNPQYNLDVATKNVAFNSADDGSLGQFLQTTNLPQNIAKTVALTANGYVYVVGGSNGTINANVYYAKINNDGTLGGWVSGTSLPAIRGNHAAIVSNGYIYVIGGSDNSNPQSTVFYAKINNDGSIGSWFNTTNLPAIKAWPTAAVANGYIYVVGGSNSKTVYFAKQNGDGTLGTWSNGSNLIQNTDQATTVVANGYLYAIGGEGLSNVYYAKLNNDGTVSAWIGTNNLSQTTSYATSVVANGYLYALGGYNGSNAVNNTYYAKLNSNGSVGSWIAGTNLPQITYAHGSIIANGYIYVLGGYDGTTYYNKTYYASLARVSLAGTLDLLGLTSVGLTSSNSASFSSGSVGGTIYAGNIFSAGNLEISGQSEFWNQILVNGNLSLYGGLFSSGNSNNAFTTFNQTGTGDIFTASSSGVTKFVINNTGNVGIGTTLPVGLLNVSGDAGSTALVSINETAGNDIFTASQAGSPKFTIKNSGNVGVGTTNPQAQLEVAGGNLLVRENSLILATNDSWGGWNKNFLQLNSGGGVNLFNVGGYGTGGTSLSYLFMGNAWNNAGFKIDNNGNVGISMGGATSPVDGFQIGQQADYGVGANVPNAYTAGFSSNFGSAQYIGGWKSSGFWGIGPFSGSNDNTLMIGNVTNVMGGTWNPNQNLVLAILGNVGVGTATPSARLEVNGTLKVTSCIGCGTNYWTLANGLLYPGNLTTDFAIGGTSTASAAFSVTGASPNQGTLSVASVSAKTSFAALVVDNSGLGDLITASSSATPASGRTQFRVTNGGSIYARSFFDLDNTNYFLDPAATTVSLTTFGGVGIGTSAPLAKSGIDVEANSSYNALAVLNQSGTGDLLVASLSGVTQFKVDNSGNVTVGAGGNGKLTALTLDPLYTIDGTKYSTYGTGMVGVKEEVTGKADLVYDPTQQAYAYTIQLNNQPQGSDLWLFSRVTDPDVGLTTVLLTPDSSASVWYTKDVASRTITLLSDEPTSVSYRFTAPRFDYSSWGNQTDISDPTVTGALAPGMAALLQKQLAASLSAQPSSPAATFNIQVSVDGVGNTIYSLVDNFGHIIKRTENFSNLIVANVQAGLGQFSQITANSISIGTKNITIGGQTLKDYIASVIEDLGYVKQPIISPIAEIDQISTNVISPLATDSKISLKLDNNKLSIINDKEGSGSAVAIIDNQGNASFSGTVNSNNLAVNNDATIGGTLHASKIIADQIEGLNIQTSTISANYITNNYYNSTPSADTNNLNLDWQNNNSGNNYIDISSFSGQIGFVQNLSSDFIKVNQGLMVFGPTSLSDVSVTGQLSIGGQMVLSDNGINVLGGDLQLQPLRQGGISFLSGLFRIDSSGNIVSQGNAEFESDVTVKGKLAAGIISPLADSDLNIALPQKSDQTGSNLNVQNSSGSAVLSINSIGDLISSGSGTFQKLNIGLVSPAYALSNTEVIATGSAGIASIKPYQTEITIDDNLVTDKSLIYITPRSNTNNNVLFLLRQSPGESFTVGANNTVSTEIPFNWIIIN